jgi:ubiquinone/menaquinone biosynthesis C-methylase UbiE
MHNRYIETFNTWNKIATLYQNKFMDLDLYNETYDFICALLNKPNSKILEIGCGPGNITKYLLSKQPSFDIFGIDIAPNMIELAKRYSDEGAPKLLNGIMHKILLVEIGKSEE